jgi:hypothetical protein
VGGEKQQRLKTAKSHPREWVDCSDLFYWKDPGLFLQIPPTEVGGWLRSFLLLSRNEKTGAKKRVSGIGRKDLNNPPTSVGGIRE